jgi:hydrogenase maturation factor
MKSEFPCDHHVIFHLALVMYSLCTMYRYIHSGFFLSKIDEESEITAMNGEVTGQ